jgi:hypothetical protein
MGEDDRLPGQVAGLGDGDGAAVGLIDAVLGEGVCLRCHGPTLDPVG